MSPTTLGLDGAAVSSASPRLWLESSSPDTILGHKSTCIASPRRESRRGRAHIWRCAMSAPREADADAAWLSNTTYPASDVSGPESPESSFAHPRRGSRRGRPARARARPPQWGSVRVGSVCVAVLNRRFRAEAGPLPWGPDPTGGSAAASRRDLNDSAGRGRLL